MSAIVRTDDDEVIVQDIDEWLDTIITIAIAARRELRHGDDREALRGAVSTLRLTASEIVQAFLKLEAGA
jgi:hypothetical protein